MTGTSADTGARVALGIADGDGFKTLGGSAAHAPATSAQASNGAAESRLIRSLAIILCPVTPRPIVPFRHPLRDIRVRVPASKSIANRELVLSAIADGRSRLDMGRLDPGDDVRAMRQALASLGYQVEWDQTFQVTVHGAETIPHATGPVHAAEAGTVARFALALAALADGETKVDGSVRLRDRPIAPLVNALRDIGATADADALPLTVAGPTRGGHVAVPGSQSSQFASALLLIAPRLERGLELEITGSLVSAPFVDLTIAALQMRGVKVDAPTLDRISVKPQKVKARSWEIPGDATAASYPAAAAAICGGSVTIENVDAHEVHGGQGDVRYFSLLEEMGCAVSRGRGTVTVRRVGLLQGIVANVRDCSDVFPSLAVIATQCETPTELGGIAHTRLQESDRIRAVADGINALGGRATAFADSIRIEPAPLHDGVVDARNDHRVAMAFAILGLQVPGVAIDAADSVSKTFPDFFAMLGELGR
jgi:3-phosphoshikimate 1-carboxyvinyltransferase